MRIKCKPEEAKYAVKDGIEFHNDDTGREPVWQIQGRGCCPTAILQALGFTFERDLPPVPDGNEYEYKKGKNTGNLLPPGSRFWKGSQWSDPSMTWRDDAGFHAIPIKKESCVEVLIIPRDRVVNDYADKNGFRFIVVREDK